MLTTNYVTKTDVGLSASEGVYDTSKKFNAHTVSLGKTSHPVILEDGS